MSDAIVQKRKNFSKKVTFQKIKELKDNIDSEIEFYKETILRFSKKYGELEDFEKKLENAEIDEHPFWEESIEWRNAVEEMENLVALKGVLEWTLNSLKQQKNSSISVDL